MPNRLVIKGNNILSWRKVIPQVDYPETSTPQNEVELNTGEDRKCYGITMDRIGYHFKQEAQNG
jgi:hypothetical protein